MKIDSIYILTCRYTKNRLPYVHRQLDTLGLSDSIPLHIFYSPSSGLVRSFFRNLPLNDYAKKNPYTFWCTFGHYLILNDIVDRGYLHSMIVEDDVRFMKNRSRFLDGISELPEDADWAQLDWWPRWGSDYYKSGKMIEFMKKNSRNIWVKPEYGFGAGSSGAYIVSTKGAKALIDLNEWMLPESNFNGKISRFMACDEFFDTKFSNDLNINYYVANPILARQAEGLSVMGRHGGGATWLYTQGNITHPSFNLNDYSWDYSL